MKFVSHAIKFQNFQVGWQIRWSYEEIYMSTQYFINRLSLIVRIVKKQILHIQLQVFITIFFNS